jgi:ribonuclease HI
MSGVLYKQDHDGGRNALSPLEKVGLALITAAKKLPQYFQAHTIYVVTQYPVQAMFQKADFTGRIWKWGAKIGTLDIKYLPRTAIKGQILADFVAEFTPTTEPEDLNKTTFQENTPENSGWWKIYVDGASNARGSGTGVVIITPDETVIEQLIRLDFKTSNNEAEYEAVLAGLNSAKTLGAQQLIVHCDSLLVTSQINGEYMARDERMAAYLLKVHQTMTNFQTVRVEQIGRNMNSHADALATLASVLNADFKRFIPIETLATPSITVPACHIHTITVGPCWMDPYVHYLKEGVLPEQKKEAEIVRRKAVRFWLSKDSKLYRRSFSGPYLLCVHPDIVEDLLFEIHEGICGSHTGGRSLAHRALTQGYWWPYMQKDAVTYVKKCDKCQRFSHSVHQPAAELLPLVSPWPFAQWGMDLVGPLPRATGNRRWLIVATDYFTKWVEAEPLANIRDKDSIKFVWKNIITRFGIPKTIISDNGTQFNSKPFMKYCSELGIRNVYSSPAYPQSNGQAEASNKTVLDGIKKRLEDAKGRWVEELPNVLWTFRTTPRRSTGETPFSLAYGSEAVIPLEIGLPTLRTSEWEPTRNNLAQSQALDLLEERREQAMIRLASYQQQLKKGYNKNVRPRSFQQGDLVLRKVLGNTKNPTDGKLGPNWEGPYRVRSVTGVGAYHLENLNSIPLPRPWNVSNLRKYFH